MPSLTAGQVESLNEVAETLEAQIKVFVSGESFPFSVEFNKRFADRLFNKVGVSYENAILISTSIKCDIHEKVDSIEVEKAVERISSVMVDALLVSYDTMFSRKTSFAHYNVDILKNIAGQMYLKL